VLSGLLKVESISATVCNELLEVRAVRPLLLLVKEGYAKLQVGQASASAIVVHVLMVFIRFM
jgi:hypothetical protein